MTWRACLLWSILALFLALRLPLLIASGGMLDEEFFAVPGWTVYQEGIPRVPYMPERDPENFFYNADRALMALPPAYFYWQAVVYAVTGPGYAEARVASLLMGVAAIVLMYWLGKSLYDSPFVGLCAAGLFAMSRIMLFAPIVARPDMMCTTASLAAIACMSRWSDCRRRRWALAAGACAGMAILTHPFGVVACVQVIAWSALAKTPLRERFIASSIVAFGAVAVFALWIPLIVSYPEEFQRQFFNNVLNRAGPGLAERIVFPWQSIVVQVRTFYELCGPFQTTALVAGVAIVTLADLRSRSPRRTRVVWLTWSAAVLLTIFAGLHSSKLYWSYPGALMFLCLARAVDLVGAWLEEKRGARAALIARLGLVVLLVASFLPGGGMRAWLAIVTHPDASHWHRPFVTELLHDTPQDVVYLVDRTYIFDFYLAGRQVFLITPDPAFSMTKRSYDLLVVGRFGLEYDLPAREGGKFLRAYGMRDAPFANYAELYESDATAARESD